MSVHHSSLFWVKKYSLYRILFIHFSVDGHLGYFYFEAIMNSVAVNIHVQFFARTCFHFLGVYLGVELLDHVFNLLRNCQTGFQSGCTILHSN